MNTPTLPAITVRRHRSLRRFAVALGLGMLAGPLLLPVRAADAVTPDAPSPDRPPREEVVIERRVVVRDGDERPREPARERDRQLAELREHAGNLQREGRSAEAERVMREIEAIEARNMEGSRPPGRPPGRPLGSPRDGGDVGELQRRLNHLHIAMENLRAAEMPDVAMEVERRANELRRQLEARARQRRPEADRPRAEVEELRREIAELRGQLEDLRREARPPKER